jgi:SH3-like domain-containing protein
MVRVKTKRRRMTAAPSCERVTRWFGGAFWAVDGQETMMAVERICIAAAMMLVGCGTAVAAEGNSTSGLPIPRFVSLKSDKVNVRAGPTKDHDVAWVYNRAALPVEVTAEFENWRRIRDWEGAEGWVYHSLLSGKRTALVSPQSRGKELLDLRDKPDATGTVIARLQHGVLASVKRCKESWCRLVGEGFDGWIEQPRLWGVYPGEQVQ